MRKNVLRILCMVFAGLHLHAMDINEAVSIALKNNNSLKKQKYTYEQVKQEVNLSKAAFQPTLDLFYNYQANSENLTGAGKDSSNASALISYNLFNGLKDIYNLKSSKYLSKGSKYTYKARKYDIIYDTKRIYINYLKSLKNIETKSSAYKLLEQQYMDSKNKFKQGILAKNDLLQVNAQMLEAKQKFFRAKSDSKIAKYNLKNILGGKLDMNEKIEDLLENTDLSDTYNKIDLNKRSEIKALEMTIKSFISQKKANNGNYMPRANLKIAYTKYGDTASLDVKEGKIKDQESAMLTLNWNLYNGQRNQTQSIIFQKRIKKAKKDLADLKLNIQLQYEKAKENLYVSKLNYKTAKVSLRQSFENYKIVRNRFKEGVSSTTDLINANFLLSSAKQSYYNAFYDRFLAKTSLDRIFENRSR